MKKVALCALLSLAACGPRYGMKVPSELIGKLPYEARIDLLEAENELAVSYDKLDEADNEIDRTRLNIRRTKAHREEADDEIDKAKDDASRQVAKLSVAESDSRLEYLRAKQDVNAVKRDLAELGLRCAKARFEIARCDAAMKSKVAGSEKLDPKAFEAQAKACDAELADRQKELLPVQAQLEKVKADWEKHKEALAQKTFDARASPYVE